MKVFFCVTAFSYESAEQVCISVILLGTSGGSRLAVLPETELKALVASA